MARAIWVTLLAGLSANGWAADAEHRHAPHFVAHDVATGLTNGYQVIAVDLNRDGRLDLLPVASGLGELAWYENPDWTRHVIADGLEVPENADVFDIDSDGVPEIGLVAGFDQTPATSPGMVLILTHRGDPEAFWSTREIDRLPTSHRARWADIDGSGRKVFVNAPLVGANAEPPDLRDQTPLVFYRPGSWQRELIATSEGLVHGLLVTDWQSRGREAVLTAGFAGVFVHELDDGRWRRTRIVAGDPAPWPKSGASDIVALRHGGERRFATVEPWHGHQLVVYSQMRGEWARHVADTGLGLGHTVVAVDVDRDGDDELLVADRGRDVRGVYLYSGHTAGEGTVTWTKEVLDQSIQASGCVGADLNQDRRLDIACIGRATANLKWYENTGE